MAIKLIERELTNVSYIIEDLLKLRLKKMLKTNIERKSLQKELLCVEEIDLFSSINNLLNNYLDNLDLILKGESPQKSPPNSLAGEYFIVRFLKDVPQIMGTDSKQYGPFAVDDIATLPKEHVETLLNHKAAMLIKKN